jgi:hypothetical protein
MSCSMHITIIMWKAHKTQKSQRTQEKEEESLVLSTACMHACLSFKESSSKWVRGPWGVVRWFPREIFFKKNMLCLRKTQTQGERQRENSDIYVWYGSGDHHHHHAALWHTDRDIRRLSGFSEDSLPYSDHKKIQNKTKPNTQDNPEQ